MADFTIPGVYSVRTVRRGDTVTIANVYALIPNPDRRWWQFWKPRQIRAKQLQTFRVIS